jgi:hypothetical protein
MRMKTILMAFLALSCLLPSACGIGTYGPADVDSRQFQDVVVPAGFRLRDVAHESFSREEATWRYGRFVYAGSTKIDDASAYVQRRMPQHSWSMVREDVGEEDDDVRLRFERGIYSADYHFTRQDGTTHMVVDYSTDYSRR